MRAATTPAYLDHAATTPLLPEARDVLVEHLGRVGNASSLHGAGRAARRVVEEARERLAAALGARPGEVVFTSGGTEADNLAVKGMFFSATLASAARRRVVVTAVEHHAVLAAAHWLGTAAGADVELLPVDPVGRLHLAALEATLAGHGGTIAVVSCMWANNEVGTLQPVEQVVAACHERGIAVHTDAVQAVGHVPVDFAASGVDLLTLTGHKLGGPYGVGALLVRRELAPVPVLHGGGQEREIRSGTLDVPGIAAFAVAVELAVRRRAELAARLAALRERLLRGVRAAVPGVVVDGDPDPAGRLPGIVHLSFPGCEGDSLLLLLDAQGVRCSTGSACAAGVAEPSHVLIAMGRDERTARAALRLSLGHSTTAADVDAAVGALPAAVERALLAGAVG